MVQVQTETENMPLSRLSIQFLWFAGKRALSANRNDLTCSILSLYTDCVYPRSLLVAQTDTLAHCVELKEANKQTTRLGTPATESTKNCVGHSSQRVKQVIAAISYLACTPAQMMGKNGIYIHKNEDAEEEGGKTKNMKKKKKKKYQESK